MFLLFVESYFGMEVLDLILLMHLESFVITLPK